MGSPSISEAEWQVMKALWEGGPAAAGEVVSRVQAQGQGWHSRTVKTMLRRLVRKGAVVAGGGGGRGGFVYRAKVTRDSCARRESRSFLARVFDGAAAPALVHFLEQNSLPADEIDRLRALLDEIQRREGGR